MSLISHRSTSGPIAAVALAVTLLGTTESRACGGLFCSAAGPVNQAAERIIFANNGDGTVTAAIEIQYEGPAHEFAWVLPVPAGEVDVAVSSTSAFDRLQALTNPNYNLQVQFDPTCNFGGGAGGQASGGASSVPAGGSGGDSFGAGGSPVVVVDMGEVGPYDYTQISVVDGTDDPGQIAVQWLTDNDYDLSELGSETLSEYLEDGMNLLAFKLSKGNEAGAIRPLMLTYPGEEPMIPIKPTAVAANDNMGVMVWVLGDARAVPSNYRHLELNEAYINWFNPNQTYNAVVSAAADEAGTHGFVTEFSGSTQGFVGVAFSPIDEENWQYINSGEFASLEQFLTAMIQVLGAEQGFVEALSKPDALPLRDGATVAQFIACPSCYFDPAPAVLNNRYPETPYAGDSDPIHQVDVKGLLAEVESLVVEPKRATDALFAKHEKVTRLYTTLSAAEMTKDPIFQFDASLEDYSNSHSATQLIACDGGWDITLPQGQTLSGSGRTWPVELGDEMPVNLRVLQLGNGAQELVEDNRDLIRDFLEDDMGVPQPPLNPTDVGAPPDPNTDSDEAPTNGTQDTTEPRKSDMDPMDDDSAASSDGERSVMNADGGGCSVYSVSASRIAAGWLSWVSAALALSWVARRRLRS